MIIRHLFQTSRLISSQTSSRKLATPLALQSPSARARAYPIRFLASKATADEKIEEIQELYATAKDEFEIAAEETEKKTVYAADDRAAAAEELAKLKTAYEEAITGESGAEIQKRIGSRIRELDKAVEALEEQAKQD